VVTDLVGTIGACDAEFEPPAPLMNRFGFTTKSGVARLGGDPLRLPRIEVKGDWTLETFAWALEKTR
jgi:hypothetical protein